jgi:hypothetical protein
MIRFGVAGAMRELFEGNLVLKLQWHGRISEIEVSY